jgi:hypothetical protein
VTILALIDHSYYRPIEALHGALTVGIKRSDGRKLVDVKGSLVRVAI